MASTRQIIQTLIGGSMPHPLIASQIVGREVIVTEGQETGMVFCPLKMAGIAEMRCIEYQKNVSNVLDVSNVSVCPCPNAVTPARAEEIRAAMRIHEVDEEKNAATRKHPQYQNCVSCGAPKPRNSSQRCSKCRNKLLGGRRQRHRRGRGIYYARPK